MATQQMKGMLFRLVVFTTLLMGASFGFSQDGTYRLQAEDIIRVQIYNEQQINAQIPIGKDGNISAPFVGIVRAAGKTTSELEQELVEIYTKKLRLRNPIVSVTIERYRELRATILGPVTRPGTFTFRQGDTIITLLGLGGGFLRTNNADLKRSVLRRGESKELIPIDLDSLMFRGDTSQNYVLQDGDELMVPENRKGRIQILGSVPRPGLFDFFEGMKLADAIALAGGEIPRQSKFSGTTVFREKPGSADGYAYIKADFVRFIHKRDVAQNITLEGGDIVWVPSTGSPNINELSNALNAAFFADRVLFRDGLFGFRPLSFIGR